MDEKKLQRAKAIIDALNTDYVSYDEAKNLFSVLQQAVQDAKTTLESLVSQSKSEVSADCQKMQKDIQAFEAGVDKLIKKLSKDTINTMDEKITKAINGVLKLIPKVPDPIIFDPTSLQNQIDVLLAYETPELEATEVRDKLETLKDEDRLDASAIKNLPEAVHTETKHVIATSTALWHLQDVDVAGIAVGQSIKWDGVRWIPFTPAGGTGTAVYNEVVSGATDTFTLAHTPTSSAILRVYANGQRLLPTTDYTLAGAIITTVQNWSAGNITADYEW